MPNNLSALTDLKFQVTSSGYGCCVDITSQGYRQQGGAIRSRHFLARISQRDVPKLIAALRESEASTTTDRGQP